MPSNDYYYFGHEAWGLGRGVPRMMMTTCGTVMAVTPRTFWMTRTLWTPARELAG